MFSLSAQLPKASSTLELATELGKVCLREEDEVLDHLQDPVAAKYGDYLESCVRRMETRLWLSPGSDGGFAHLLDDDAFREALARVEVYPPLEALAVLKGMLGAVRHVYDNTSGAIDLKLGMPLPIPKRGVPKRFKPTPASETATLLDLLWKSGFSLFSPRPGVRASVRLDFSVAQRLDELTWVDDGTSKKRFPRIATIHPSLGRDGLTFGEKTAPSFFGVKPRNWNRESVLQQLRAVAGAVEIALLPELSLPQVDALEASLAATPESFPPLVVAGSAHVEDPATQLRANESRIYLDGKRIGCHRKIQPFVMRRDLDSKKLKAPLTENLSTERKTITVFAGDYTRLTVMICSDLISRKLVSRLEDAEVNLLLVPAMTPEPGSFNGKICKLASDYQAVCVIANADNDLFQGWAPPPFLLMAAVPRPRTKEQSREFRRRWRGCPTSAVIDPNQRLRRAVKWR